jgi:CRISP-associated protein Cas1
MSGFGRHLNNHLDRNRVFLKNSVSTANNTEGALNKMNQLIITDYGTYLGKHSERVTVKYRDKERPKEEHAMIDLEQIVVSSRGVSLSSDLIEACTQRGIEIAFLSFNGKPFAKLMSPALTATVISRREQLAAYHDDRGFEIARRFALGKVRNQINLVRYFGKYRKKRAPKKYAELMERVEQIDGLRGELAALAVPSTDAAPIDEARFTLLNLEGRAGALYWECVQRLLPTGRFVKREHQGADDDVNSLLNYGYGILYSQVWSALTLAGLEPFAGFLHVDRPGKPSLVLDFIEEFRQPVVDQVVFALINKGFTVEWENPDADAAKAAHQATESPQDTELKLQRRLSQATRRALADRVLARLQEMETFERKQQKLANIIQMQARHLAMFLRREWEYKPFVAKW